MISNGSIPLPNPLLKGEGDKNSPQLLEFAKTMRHNAKRREYLMWQLLI